jgi:hypothetical protein
MDLRRLVPLLLALPACGALPDAPNETYLRLNGRLGVAEARFDTLRIGGRMSTHLQLVTSRFASLVIVLPGVAPAGPYVTPNDVTERRVSAGLLLGDGVTGYNATTLRVFVTPEGDRLTGRLSGTMRALDGRAVRVEGAFDARRAPLVMTEG